jgi:hypothetical protein
LAAIQGTAKSRLFDLIPGHSVWQEPKIAGTWDAGHAVTNLSSIAEWMILRQWRLT